MNKNKLTVRAITTLIALLSANNLYAATQPKFTIIPLTSTTIAVAATDIAKVQYQVTNQTEITRTLTVSPIAGVTQVTDEPSDCQAPFTLAAHQSCKLTLQITAANISVGYHSNPVEVCKTNSANNGPILFLCSQTSPQNHLNITRLEPTANIIVSPRTLTMNDSVGRLTLTNESTESTASNIQASFTGTALNGLVLQDASQCKILRPQESCNLVFYSKGAPITLTPFSIQGDNTKPIGSAIRIASASAAQIAVANSPLILTTGDSARALLITNNSFLVTATNVQATLPPALTNSGVTQNATDCTILAPQSTCSLVFTPGTRPVAPTTVFITGMNASLTAATIAENDSTQISLAITEGSPLALAANGIATGTMTITNQSLSSTATNIAADFTNTALIGNVSATTCINPITGSSAIAPGESCIITYTASTNVVTATGFPISGVNTVNGAPTTTGTGVISLTSYYAYIANSGSSNIVLCNANSSTGALSGCATATSVDFASDVTINDSGTALYAAGSLPPTITSCIISRSSGALSSCNNTPLASSGLTGGVAYNPQLRIVYVTISTDMVMQCSTNPNGTVNGSTCINSGATGLNVPTGITVDPSFTYVYIVNSGNSLVTKCTIGSTGNLSSCSNMGSLGTLLWGIDIDSTGAYAYITNSFLDLVTLASIDASGDLITVSSDSVSGGTSNAGILINSASKFAYVVSASNNTIQQCLIDESTGGLSECVNSGASSLNNPEGIALYPRAP